VSCHVGSSEQTAFTLVCTSSSIENSRNKGKASSYALSTDSTKTYILENFLI
jgi:hypothetical protein